jgi:hypothetical protein
MLISLDFLGGILKMNKLPNMFLAGASKSGTTSLAEYLKQHPEVFMPEVIGPNYFGEHPNGGFPKFFKNKKKYLSLYKKVKDEKVLSDISHLLQSESAPKAIIKFNSKAKIVITLKNPLKAIYSHYKDPFYHPIPDSCSFEDFINWQPDEYSLAHENVKYSRNIKRYFKVFPKNQIHFIIFEDFIKNPELGYRKLCEFLDIDAGFVPSFEKHNQNRIYKNKWLMSIIKFTSVGLRVFFKEHVPEPVKLGVQNFIQKVITKKKIKNKMDPELERRLFLKFDKEIKTVEKLLNKNLDCWRPK